MILLDTDTFTLFVLGHTQVIERARTANDLLALPIITRIEVLRGRFDALLKAADADQLQRAQQRLDRSEHDLQTLPIIPVDAAAAFDTLRQNKKLKKIGRADLLIAAIALAQRATLVTRNLKHFEQVPQLLVENWVD